MELDELTPYGRTLKAGIGTASLQDLVAIVLSRTENDTLQNEGHARQMIVDFGADRLTSMGRGDLQRRTAMNVFDCDRLLAAIEIGRRCEIIQRGKREKLGKPADVWRRFRYLADYDKEHFCVACLDSKGGVIAGPTIHIGTVNSSIVGAREVFREALRQGATSVVLVHNHPSGDPEPSPEDIEITRSLIKAGEMLDLPVLDHLIIGHDPEYVSLHQRGLI